MADLFGLSARHALVTGASSGLGRHFAGVLAAAGAKVTVAARREAALAEAVASIRDHGTQAQAVRMDVTSASSVEQAFAGEVLLGALERGEMGAEADARGKIEYEEIQNPPGPRLGSQVVETEGLTKGFDDRVLIEKGMLRGFCCVCGHDGTLYVCLLSERHRWDMLSPSSISPKLGRDHLMYSSFSIFLQCCKKYSMLIYG